MQAGVYARYSSDLQRPSSIEDQVRQCRTTAARLDYAVADAHVCTDYEISGATVDRPGYRRLMDLARAREIDAIIVESQDRLWRHQAEMHAALDRLRFWGVRVIAATTGTDLTDRTGRLVASVTGWRDEAFLEELRDKTRRGMAGQIHRGLSAGGRTFGYLSEPLRDESGRVIGARRVVNPAEAEVICHIFRLYADGLTPRAIAHRLNADQVPAPRTARGRRTGSWTPSTIAGSTPRALGILNNPLYVGRLVWNRSEKVRDPDSRRRIVRARPPADWLWTEVPELRIILDDLWERVQSRRQQRRFTATGTTGGARAKYLLSGLLVCGECGGRYVVQRHRAGVRHYGCAVHYDRGPAVCTNGRLVRREVIEQKILNHVFGDLFAPHRVAYLSQAVDEVLAEEVGRSTGTLAVREAALQEARQELDHIASAIRQGVVTVTTKQMLEETERRVAGLEAVLRETKRRPVTVVSVRSVVDRYLEDLRATVAGDVDEARRLLARGLDRIVLRQEEGRLMAEVRGNLAGLLNLEDGDMVARVGAGRGI